MDATLDDRLLSAGSNINESPSASVGGSEVGGFARHRRRILSIKIRLRNCP